MKSKKAYIAVIALFLVFTFGFFVMFVALPKAEYSSMEKRYLAEFPEISPQSFVSGELTSALEGGESGGYIPDHFPFRSLFVGVNAYWNLLTGTTASNGYYYGDDGYIITKPAAANRSEQNLSLINSFSASFDEVTLMVVPSAGYVLSDKLPQNSVDYPDREVYAYIEDNAAENIQVCSVTEEFEAKHREGTQLYYRTDHHWTSEGAYAAYTALCDALGQTPVAREEFTVSEYPDFYGTTYSSSGYFLRNPDTLEIWENKSLSEGISVEITEGSNTETYDSMYFPAHLEEDDMYPVFLDGNHALVKITNENAKSQRTLLMVKDSFAHCAAPFLAENYSKVIMVDLRYYKLPVSMLAESEGADDILFLYGMNNFCTDTNLGYLE